ncbi:xanthine dehydrogenase family protein molybdopterin-binding subunit [Gammaproteobacteria bacterium]|nr:xanthine dehydrogenase family protein molybdopterin-binding subunit [Gammaproteobacteria bacterium]
MGTKNSTMNRRQFIGSGAALTLSLALPLKSRANVVAPQLTPNAFIRIGGDNSVTLVLKHLEMGQGSYTGLATLLAEELDADWDSINFEAAPADASQYGNAAFGGIQGTGGSTAMASSHQIMRQAGAAARQMLVAAAAERWGVSTDAINVDAGVVSGPDGQQAHFGDLVADAAARDVPDGATLTLKTPERFKLIGNPNLKRLDAAAKSRGEAIFTQDIQFPDMLTAVVAYPPRFGATVASVDDSAARAIVGVVDVQTLPFGVAVLASGYWQAKKGRDALVIEWDESAAFAKSSDQLLGEYRELADSEGLTAGAEGDVEAALSSATRRVDLECHFPYLAHAAMEPMNCVAQITEGGAELWYGAQLQTLDQGAVAQVLGILPEKVKINTLYAGGGFGRRASTHADYVVETALIAQAHGQSVPIKLVRSREDDMRAGYYRPMYVHKLSAGIDAEGKPSAWKQHIVGQSIATGTAFEGFMVHDGVDHSSVEGAVDMPYPVPNRRFALTTDSDNPIPVLWWRSVGHTHTAFAKEVMIDRLALAADVDPVDYRLSLLDDSPRLANVLRLASEKAGAPREGLHRGVATHFSFNTYAAQIVDVRIDESGKWSLQRVVCAVDCGLVINPEIVRVQAESSIGFALSMLKYGRIDIDNGAVTQSNFHDYPVIRLPEMPVVEVHTIASAEAPTGMGEPAVPPLAPAVVNALHRATGKSYTVLPIGDSV